MSSRRDPDWLRGGMAEVFSDLVRSGRRGARRAFQPAVDVYRRDDPPEVTVVVDLAGVDPSEMELAFSGGVLTIGGLRRRQHEGGAVYQQMEVDYGPFERSVFAGEDVDPGGAEAIYDRGLLTVRMPLVSRPAPSVRVVIAVVRRA